MQEIRPNAIILDVMLPGLNGYEILKKLQDKSGMGVIMLTGEAAQIAVNTESYSTSWSSSGEKLAYTQYHGTQYNSSIIYFK